VNEFYIVTTAHEAIWPRGVILFWAANESGYSTSLEHAGRYSEDQAKKITSLRRDDWKPLDFMVPCEVVEAAAIRVVDIDKLRTLVAAEAA
jgi:hypothetical protein